MEINKVILALAAALLAIGAQAGDLWYSPYSHTKHFKEHCGYKAGSTVCEKYLDSHPSIGIEYVENGKSIAGGLYRDSYGGTAAYFSRHWFFDHGLGMTTGVLMSESYPYKFVPFVGPEFTVKLGDVKFSAAYLPAFGLSGQPDIGVINAAIRF